MSSVCEGEEYFDVSVKDIVVVDCRRQVFTEKVKGEGVREKEEKKKKKKFRLKKGK